MAYAQTRKDFEYLESIEQLDDWVEIQGDTISLMEEPTKKKGEEFYFRCICLWFMEANMDGRHLNKRTKSIKERYGI